MYVSGKTVLSRSGLWKVHVACWAGGQDKVYVTARHGISRTRLCSASIVGRRTEHGTVNGTYYTLHACPWFALLYSLMTCHAYETRIISTHTHIALTPWSRRISESELDRRALLPPYHLLLLVVVVAVVYKAISLSWRLNLTTSQ